MNVSFRHWHGLVDYYWNLQFLINVTINKTKVLLPQSYIGDLSWFWLSFLALWFYCSQNFKLFGFPFQSFDFERTWWRLFQKRVVRTKLDIYGFIWRIWLYCLCSLVLFAPMSLTFCISNPLTLVVPDDEGYSRKASCALKFGIIVFTTLANSIQN
jgi:hypothetical protein